MKAITSFINADMIYEMPCWIAFKWYTVFHTWAQSFRENSENQGTHNFLDKTCICPVIEYASSVFHNSLPSYLSDEVEGLQKHAMRMIFFMRH